MKLYALIGGFSYEGYDDPVGIFSSLEKAEEARKIAYDGYDTLKIHEYELDVVPEHQRHEPQGER